MNSNDVGNSCLDEDELLFGKLLLEGSTLLSELFPKQPVRSNKKCAPPKVFTYKCAYCPLKLSTTEKMEEHMKIHYRYPCKVCYTVFISDKELEKHMAFMHYKSVIRSASTRNNAYGFVCELCYVVLPTKIQLRNHIDSKHRQIRREITRYHPTIAAKLQTLLIKDDKHDKWQCKDPCFQTFDNKEQALDHCELHVKGLSYLCKNGGCNKTFGARLGLLSHKKVCRVTSTQQHKVV